MNFKRAGLFLSTLAALLFLSGCASYHMRQGNRLYDQMAYSQAVKEYEKALDSDYKNQAQRKLAAAYLKMNNVDKARQYMEALVKDTAAKADASERSQYANLLFRAGRYADAKTILEQNPALDNSGKTMLSSCDSLVAWQQDSLRYLITKSSINGGGESNFSPYYYKEGILFVSDRGKGSARNSYEWTGRPFLDVYYAKVDGAGQASSPTTLSGELNGIYHEGPVAIAGDTLYLTRNNYVKKKVGKSEQEVVNFKLYQLHRKDSAWVGLKELPFNSNDFSTGHPALSADGNTIYFSSDRPGGTGGSDLYKSVKTNGVWGEPQNLGSTYNTAGNECFPMVWKDSALYFSSDGMHGLGGLDIFKASLINGTLGTPVNVGYPFNTSYDDFGVAINEKGTEGYFSSNRDGKNTEIDQIYRVEFQDIRFTLQGIAVKKNTLQPVEGVLVELKNLTTGKTETTLTGPDGTFKFKLDPRSNYSVSGSKDGYFTNSEEVSTVGKVQSEDMVVKLKLELEEIIVNKPIVLENIYYDLDKSDIRADAKPGLDKLVEIMKENPGIRIELGSHTDSRADDDYNMKLSQRRAESAVKYIVENGIEASRISAKGYGETQLVNGCDNKTQCSEEEHQANRRTEFKVVSIDK
jgi:peptidoglycan-associated lipoprotein